MNVEPTVRENGRTCSGLSFLFFFFVPIINNLQFRASLAIAAGVAMTLRYGVDHLSKGAVGIADGDSDEDVLALYLLPASQQMANH